MLSYETEVILRKIARSWENVIWSEAVSEVKKQKELTLILLLLIVSVKRVCRGSDVFLYCLLQLRCSGEVPLRFSFGVWRLNFPPR